MTKIRIRVGEVEVEYEGPEAFLNKKLPDLIKQLSGPGEPVPGAKAGSGRGAGRASRGGDPGTLASFLKSKNVANTGVGKFLATAEWLHQRGAKQLTTSQVSQALVDNRQGRLRNPSDCLNKNVGKGHCEKVGREFYVTNEGRSSLG